MGKQFAAVSTKPMRITEKRLGKQADQLKKSVNKNVNALVKNAMRRK